MVAAVATPIVSLKSYVNAVVGLLFWMGIGFETPFLMFFFTSIGIATPLRYLVLRKIV